LLSAENLAHNGLKCKSSNKFVKDVNEKKLRLAIKVLRAVLRQVKNFVKISPWPRMFRNAREWCEGR